MPSCKSCSSAIAKKPSRIRPIRCCARQRSERIWPGNSNALTPKCRLYLRAQAASLQALFHRDGVGLSWGFSAERNTNDIRPISAKRGLFGKPAHIYSFAEVERAILKELPTGFPIRDPVPGTELHYSQSLFVVPVRFFKNRGVSSPVMIDAVSLASIANGLGALVKEGASSVFTRLGITLPSGDPVVICTQQFRHMLNTILQRGGGRPDGHRSVVWTQGCRTKRLLRPRYR